METLYPRLILDALTNVRYPGNGKNIVELGMVEDDIRIGGNKELFADFRQVDRSLCEVAR